MENITLGQISAAILFIVAFFGGMTTLFKYIKKWLRSLLNEEFKVIQSELNKVKDDIKSLHSNLDEEAISNCKNFLVSCYAKIESGMQLDETEKERYYEEYDIYTNKYHQNSYIHSKHEKLRKEGKL